MAKLRLTFAAGDYEIVKPIKEGLTKEEADRHHAEHHSEVEVGE